MKRLLSAALLASAFLVPTTLAQDSGSAQAPKQRDARPPVKAEKQEGKEGQDCDTNRAGVRCSRPKPKKVWFWGKA